MAILMVRNIVQFQNISLQPNLGTKRVAQKIVKYPVQIFLKVGSIQKVADHRKVFLSSKAAHQKQKKNLSSRRKQVQLTIYVHALL